MFKPKMPEIPGQQRLQDLVVATKLIRKGNYVYPVMANATGDEDCYTATLGLAMEGVRDTYLNRCYSCTVSDPVFEVRSPTGLDHINAIRSSITRAINRITRLRKFDKEHPIEFHMRSDNYSAHVTLIDDRRDPGVGGVVGHLYIADDQLEGVMIGIINITPDGTKFGMGTGAVVMYAAMTMYFMSKKYNVSDKMANAHKDVCKFGIMGSFELYLLETMLYKLIDQIKTSEPGIHNRYLPIETWMFGTIIKDLGAKMEAHTVFTWAREEDIYDEILPIELDKAPEEVYPNLTPNHPKIDFDTKEWKFIDGYCKRNNLLQNDPIDLNPYFCNPRYGNVYTLNAHTEYNIDDSLVIAYTISDTNMRLFITETINEFTSIVLIADFININRFNMDCIRKIRKCVLYTNFDHMFASVDDLINVSPLLQADIDNTTGLIREILKFFIVMHDRPERSRMIKGIKHTTIPNTNKKKNGDKCETTEVVWRVLKPVKAAKEYVQSMSIGAPRNIEYTLEEWSREGHPRRLKSGKVIWIEPTTCRRRDDLLKKDKDIKIKL